MSRGGVMKIALKPATIGKTEGISPRDRIRAVAADLFYRHGIRAVGVESIAAAAATNKMTLHRHFGSKDRRVAAYLRCFGGKGGGCWGQSARQHPGRPPPQLRGWLEDLGHHRRRPDQRRFAVAKGPGEVAGKHHPARPVIEA